MEAEFAREVLTRLPLTEAVLSLWRWVADPLFLLSVFTRHCGVGYEKEIRFGVLEQLIVDALLEHQGSGRKSFERGREQRLLTASIQAVYQKVGRISLGLSEAWLAESTARVRPVYPSVAGVPLPSSRQGLEVILVDGKAIKRAAKRLKPLQGRKGGVLGGKALVALELRRRLAVDMATNPDGETNDAKRVPTLLPQVRAHVAGARLWGPIGSSVTSPRRRPLPQGRITPRALSSQDSLLPRGAAARTVWAGCSERQWVEGWGVSRPSSVASCAGFKFASACVLRASSFACPSATPCCTCCNSPCT